MEASVQDGDGRCWVDSCVPGPDSNESRQEQCSGREILQGKYMELMAYLRKGGKLPLLSQIQWLA